MGSSLTPPDLLPVTWSHLEETDLDACYGPQNRGADFYDGLTVSGRVLFLLTDISAVQQNFREVAQKVQIVFRQTAQQLFQPAEVNESDAVAELAHAVNLGLMEAAGGARISPTFLGCFNQALGILTYVSGGDLPAMFREHKQVRVLEPGGMPLGLFTHTTFEAAVLAFQRGDALLLTTKGVSESKRGKEDFGVQRVMRSFNNAALSSASEICRRVLQHAEDFTKVPWWYVRAHLRARKQSAHQDRTALALIRL